MNNNIKKSKDTAAKITRTEAMKKMGNYGKYAALTAIGTFLILNPKKAQAGSPVDPGDGFLW